MLNSISSRIIPQREVFIPPLRMNHSVYLNAVWTKNLLLPAEKKSPNMKFIDHTFDSRTDISQQTDKT